MKEQIEEIGKLCPFYEEGKCNLLDGKRCDFNCDMFDFAEILYNAGYRKQSEVIDEFAERIKKEFTDYPNPISYLEIEESGFCKIVDRLAKEMKGGAE